MSQYRPYNLFVAGNIPTTVYKGKLQKIIPSPPPTPKGTPEDPLVIEDDPGPHEGQLYCDDIVN
jgi:hypothetical protein